MNLLERREFLKGLAATAAAISLYPNLLLRMVDQESEQFLWTREEILFGPQAGFEQARAQIPLAVYLNPGIPLTMIENGIKAWNGLAHELGRGDLFRIENDSSKAEIVVIPSRRIWVTAYPDYQSPFEWCHIELHIELLNSVTADIPRLVAHEFGHTLGFVDFAFATTNLEGLVNPQRCDLPDKPIRSIMAANSRWFGEHDPKMLQLAGYV